MYCVAYNYELIMDGQYNKELPEGTFHEKSVGIFNKTYSIFHICVL